MILLRVFGLLYCLSGLHCAINMDSAAGFLGLGLTNTVSYAEFFSVYGGLQVGLGLAMLLASLRPSYVEASVFFAAVFSSGLLAFRLLSLGLYSQATPIVAMAVLEWVIAVLLWLNWRRLAAP